MAAFTDKLVDPLIGDMHGEEVVSMRENIFTKAFGVANQVAFQLTNRSSVPDAMPVDNPVPAPIKRKKVGENEGPQEQGYGPLRGGRQLVNAIGLDGETVKYVIGSMASASSSAAVAVGSAAVQYVRTDGKDNLIHNVKVLSGAAASGTGAVLNVAAGTARIAASGTGAALNFAGSKMMANMTEDDYRENVAETQRVIHAQQTSAVMAQIHDRAYQVQQENQRLALEAENQRKAEVAMAKAQQQELDFQDARSVASSLVRAKHGPGRRGNVTRALQGRPPATEQLVRNEDAVGGLTRKLIRGVSGLLGR
jgi:hypothetical protein